MKTEMPRPHGGKLVNLINTPEKVDELRKHSKEWPSWFLTERQLCDLELLMTGAFSPLNGFLCKDDYESVLSDCCLKDKTLWPMPIVLDINEEMAKQVKPHDKLALRDSEGHIIAILTIKDKWKPDKLKEAEAVYGTTDEEHPGVYHLLHRTHDYYIGGKIDGMRTPPHDTYPSLWMTPQQLRDEISTKIHPKSVVTFQTRNPMHRAHYELTLLANQSIEGSHLLIHPVVGMTKPGDVDTITRIRCYQAIMQYYPPETATLALFPLAMRMAGPREAMWHAIIQKNYGSHYFIVGRDHAGPSRKSTGKPFYDPYGAQNFLRDHEKDLDIQILPFQSLVYVKELDQYLPEDEVPKGMNILSISGTELRHRLQNEHPIPEWLTFPSVKKELHLRFPPKKNQGFTIFLTGLPSAGKSTIARALYGWFLEWGGKSVTLLDGDVVRTHLSTELGFTRADRDKNVMRIGYVASEITKHGGAAICAPIAPYEKTRKDLKEMIEIWGRCFIIHVNTPLDVCEDRDPKGLYAKARAGIIKHFTGISDVYEDPVEADLRIDTNQVDTEEAIRLIMKKIAEEGFIDLEDIDGI